MGVDDLPAKALPMPLLHEPSGATIELPAVRLSDKSSLEVYECPECGDRRIDKNRPCRHHIAADWDPNVLPAENCRPVHRRTLRFAALAEYRPVREGSENE